MADIYRVTAADVKTTKNGHAVFELTLDDSIRASKLIPVRRADQLFDKLYKFYAQNGNTIKPLIGNFVAVSLNDSSYGKQFKQLASVNAVGEFQLLLDSCDGLAFSTNMNMFAFLQHRGRAINADGSITLNDPYEHLCVRQSGQTNVCYPSRLGPNMLNFENLELIFNEFFKGKFIDNGNPDRDEQYDLTPTGVCVYWKAYHKSLSKTINSGSHPVLTVGQVLSEEHQAFLLSLPVRE